MLKLKHLATLFVARIRTSVAAAQTRQEPDRVVADITFGVGDNDGKVKVKKSVTRKRMTAGFVSESSLG